MSKLLYCPVCGKIMTSVNKCCPNCKGTMKPTESLFDSSYYKNKSEKIYGYSAWAFKILILEEASNSTFFEKSKCVFDVDSERTRVGGNITINEANEQAKVIDKLKGEISQCHKNMLISVLVCLVSFALAFLSGYIGSDFLIGVLLIISFGAFFVFCSFLGDRQKKAKDLALAQTNYSEYKKALEQRAAAEKRYQAAAQNIQSASHPKCPSCGSTNTKKIGNLNRTASVAMWGLASSKIGKQYECNNCGHKW